MTEDIAIAPSLADEQRDLARSRILRAAGTALATRGLAATIDDVAEEAGVNRRTVFRHFSTRDNLFAAAIQAGIARYGQRIPPAPESSDLRSWLLDLLVVTHRLNAENGHVFWELSALQPDNLSDELAAAATDCRASRNRFATAVTARLWNARHGHENPPEWLVDAIAVQLSGFTTQALSGDLGRTPDEVAHICAHTVEATLTAALNEVAWSDVSSL
ncbi:TetR/AcrR family transcriptional regulator [Fodinicola feengrottensis]|uniref:HTH tetR-type domain-containing protein n=1 Tax=Fodinicola feengrottensis TaxID=435914 RepID=A0ABP4S0R9_9ACTN|nr:TetR/AcrR family transcriptional regulator [Fodinicola feengrottensis]